MRTTAKAAAARIKPGHGSAFTTRRHKCTVFVSTRSHGSLRPQYPFYEQFNSIVAYVRQPGESGVLLDATDPYQPVNELRDEHYNGGGWQLDSRNPEWLVMLRP